MPKCQQTRILEYGCRFGLPNLWFVGLWFCVPSWFCHKNFNAFLCVPKAETFIAYILQITIYRWIQCVQRSTVLSVLVIDPITNSIKKTTWTCPHTYQFFSFHKKVYLYIDLRDQINYSFLKHVYQHFIGVMWFDTYFTFLTSACPLSY